MARKASIGSLKAEISAAIKPILPKGWKLEGVYPEDDEFVVNCPLDTYMGDRKTWKKVVRAIEKATGAENVGGGCLLGSGEYNNEFAFGNDNDEE